MVNPGEFLVEFLELLIPLLLLLSYFLLNSYIYIFILRFSDLKVLKHSDSGRLPISSEIIAKPTCFLILHQEHCFFSSFYLNFFAIKFSEKSIQCRSDNIRELKIFKEWVEKNSRQSLVHDLCHSCYKHLSNLKKNNEIINTNLWLMVAFNFIVL